MGVRRRRRLAFGVWRPPKTADDARPEATTRCTHDHPSPHACACSGTRSTWPYSQAPECEGHFRRSLDLWTLQHTNRQKGFFYPQPMHFLRLHWFDLGGVFAAGTGVWLWLIWGDIGWYDRLCWLSLISLFLHQLEEYRVVGTFPGMLNGRVFRSDLPDRYPLNTNTSLIINVAIGWTVYMAAVAASTHAVWLGIAAMCVNLANGVAHLIVFNVRGHTFYNPGMVTGTLLHLPLCAVFVVVVVGSRLATPTDWIVGLALGAVLCYGGLVHLLLVLADRNTSWVFPSRCVGPHARPPRR